MEGKYHIGILYGNELIYDNEEPFDSEKLMIAYNNFFNFGKEQKVIFYLAHYKEYENKKLKKAWIFEDKWKIVENAEIEFIYDKFNIYDQSCFDLKNKIKEELGIINDPEFEELCKDKFLTYKLFSFVVPKTFLVKNKKELEVALKNLDSEKIVLKPMYGTGGEGVVIADKSKIFRDIGEEMVVQEFVDSSSGIEDLNIKGVHDLRVVVIDGEIVDSYVRQPTEGLISNLSLGGHQTIMDISKMQDSVIDIVKKADKKFLKFENRIYSVDIIFDKDQKPWILEFNTKPGITDLFYEQGKLSMKEMIGTIVNAVKKKRSN